MPEIIKVTDEKKAAELVRKAFGPEHTLGCYLGNMSDEEFTQSRRGKVGGSDMAAIFGGTKNRWVRKDQYEIERHTNYDVYGEYILERRARHPRIELKRRLRYPDVWLQDPTIDEGTRRIFKLGHENEPRIAQLYADEHPEDKVYDFPWRVHYNPLPFCIKDIDYLCETHAGEFYVLECKNPQMWTTQKGWQLMAEYGNTDDLSGLVDECYLMQVWFYLLGTEMKYARIVAGGWSLHEIGYTKVPRLPYPSETTMVQSIKRIVPLLTRKNAKVDESDFPDKKELLKAYTETYKYLPLLDEEIDLPQEYASKIEELHKTERKIEEAKREYKRRVEPIEEELGIGKEAKCWRGPLIEKRTAIQASIACALGEHKRAKVKTSDGSVYRIVYDYRKTARFDEKAFKADHPELYEQYYDRNKKHYRKMIVT